jgi:NTE family protein
MTTSPEAYARDRTSQIRWMGKPPRQRVGLAMGGGAARGIAHIGVLEVLAQHHIQIDCIAGTSAGAIVGGMYAAGLSPQRMEELVRRTSWLEIASLSLPKLGLLNFDRVTQWIEDCLKDHPARFEDLKMPFAAVAADIVSGDLVAITEGKLADALRASASVPGILTPIRLNGHLLVDGGIVNNLPVSVTRRLGADYVIAIDLLPPGTVGGKEPQNVMELTLTAFYMLMRSTHKDGAMADRVIVPKIGHINLVDLGRVDDLLEAGRIAAEEAVPLIKQDLGMNEEKTLKNEE